MSTIGHPLADLANLAAAYYLPYTGNVPFSGLGGLEFEKYGIPTLNQTLERYASKTSTAFPDPFWDFHMGFYYFKGAIISQGIIARTVKGAASSDFSSAFGALIPTFGEEAKEVCDALRTRLAANHALPVQPEIVGNILPEDDFTHQPGKEANYNESVYFNFFDPEIRFGGFLRIGNRPNEGYAETTVCLYLPDSSVLFAFKYGYSSSISCYSSPV